MNPNDLNNNDDRTRAFTLEKKQRRNDSIGWIVGSLFLFVFNIISIGRITVVGQFFDDVIFTFMFGWFKYFIYLISFITCICIYSGIKFKFKKRFLLMVSVTWIVLCWFISSILFIVVYATPAASQPFPVEAAWTKSILGDSISSYVTSWKDHSLWSKVYTSHSWIISNTNTYFNVWAGGGFIGTLLTGLFSYLSIFGSLIFALFALFLVGVYVLTGDPFFLFKPKAKRVGKRLRVLSLSGKHNGEKRVKREKKPRAEKGIFSVINTSALGTSVDQRQILSSIHESDFTIEMPSFRKNNVDIYSQQPYQPSPYDNQQPYQQPQNPYNDIYSQQPNDGIDIYGNDYNTPVAPVNDIYSQQPVQQVPPVYNQAPVEPQPSNIMPRRQRNLNDIPESKYGDVSTDVARKMFEKESAVTPFGAPSKPKTEVEVPKPEPKAVIAPTPVIKDAVHTPKQQSMFEANQVTLDQLLNEAEEDDKQKQKALEQYSQYKSPIKQKINNYVDYGDKTTNQTQVVAVDKNKSYEKEVFVDENFQLPPLTLLNAPHTNSADLNAVSQLAKEKEEAINGVFAAFKVNAKVSNATIGPTVIKFEIQPEPGTKVSSITALENDLKLQLASQNVRMEFPIPGKQAVGIEIPNPLPQPVPFRNVISDIPMNKVSNKTLFAIGKTVTGELVFGELNKMPHLLVAGSTGSGKSVMINGIITSILMRAKPHEVKFLLIDPKKVEMSIYQSIPHLLAPVISDMHMANDALKKVINEMERRYALFSEYSVKNIDGFNKVMKDAKKRLPYYIVIIDELADLMMTANKKDVEESIMRLTQMARAAGIHLIVATQRPSTDVLTGVIKSNIPTRIAFMVASSIDSRTILDSVGAEKLIGKGDMLYSATGSPMVRAQGAYVSDEEIMKVVDFVSKQQQQHFDDEFMKPMASESHDGGGNGGSGQDPLFEEIKQYVISVQKASTSLLQRKFSIGYNRSSRIIDELEESGIIGPANGSKPREVFIKNENM